MSPASQNAPWRRHKAKSSSHLLDRHVRPGLRRLGAGQQEREEMPRRLVVLLGGRGLKEVISAKVITDEKCVRSRDVASDNAIALIASQTNERFETRAEEVG